MKKLFIIACLFFAFYFKAEACTGISMFSANGSYFQARTIEWAGSNLNSVYVVVPRNFSQTSFTPKGKNGMTFKSKYGYVGLAVQEKEFIEEYKGSQIETGKKSVTFRIWIGNGITDQTVIKVNIPYNNKLKEIDEKLASGSTKGLVGTEKGKIVDGEFTTESATAKGEISKKEFATETATRESLNYMYHI